MPENEMRVAETVLISPGQDHPGGQRCSGSRPAKLFWGIRARGMIVTGAIRAGRGLCYSSSVR